MVNHSSVLQLQSQEEGRRWGCTSSHFKMTEDSFDVGQDALPVGPAHFQHLLHALSYSCHANVRTPAGLKQNSQYLCKRQRSHQCGRDSNTLSGFKGQVQIVLLLEAAFRIILNWFNVPLLIPCPLGSGGRTVWDLADRCGRRRRRLGRPPSCCWN